MNQVMAKKMFFVAGTGIAVLLLFVYIFFPLDQLNNSLRDRLAEHGLVLVPDAHKSILPGLAWDNLTLSSEKGPLFKLDKLIVRPQYLQLLAGRVVCRVEGVIAEALLQADYDFKGKHALELSITGLPLSDLDFLKTLFGGKADGLLSCKGSLTRTSKGLSGEIRFELENASFAGMAISGFKLPSIAGVRVQGLVSFLDSKAKIQSFNLEGDGVYMRLSGDMPSNYNSPLNLMLEIMPKPDLLEQQKMVFLLMARFMTSPGHYMVPVRGTLLKPQIS